MEVTITIKIDDEELKNLIKGIICEEPEEKEEYPDVGMFARWFDDFI